jgi:hypothetical protein
VPPPRRSPVKGFRRFRGTRRRHRPDLSIRRAWLAPTTRRREPLRSWNLTVRHVSSRRAPCTRDEPPEMRPADICNPHIKDEHPGSARLRRSHAVSAAIHATTPASSSWDPDHGRLFANLGGGPAATLTPPSPIDGGWWPPVNWPRPLSPPPREERRLPRPETPSTIERLSTNPGVPQPSPAPEPVNAFRRRRFPD